METRRSDLLHDFYGMEPSDYPSLPTPRRIEKNGWEIFEGSCESFSYKTVSAGEIQKFDGERKMRLSSCVSEIISEYIGHPRSLLAAGIGNRYIAADSVGPLVCKKLAVGEVSQVKLTAISPGTPAQTGIDTSRLVSIAAESEVADVVLTIDSLCASKTERLLSIIQVSDMGLTPCSALTHTSSEISSATMPSRVVSIGVPTVFYHENKLLTTADIDASAESISTIIAAAVNRAVFSRK